MIILHASSVEGRLMLWGEAAPEPDPRRTRAARGRKPALARARYALEEDRLARVAAERFPELALDTRRAERLVAWLPSNDAGAIASSPILVPRPEPVEPAKVRLEPWEIPALELSTADCARVLPASLDQVVWRPGVVVGKPLAYWASVFRFACGIVARQQYLPAVERVAGGICEARWMPALLGSDRLEAERLARAMPHACRALGRDPQAPPMRPAADVMMPLLGALVDTLVRESAGRKPHDRRRTFPSVHDAWVAALKSNDGRLAGSASELNELAAAATEWRRPVERAAHAPYRLCFRLTEPAANAPQKPNSWRVSFLLQSVREPSLLVPAKKVWTDRGKATALLAESGFEPREYLLSALGQAAILCPRIAASLRSRSPAGYGLDSRGAHEFLSTRAAALEQAGFGVFLPSWWTRAGAAFRLTASAQVRSPRLRSQASLSLDAILDFEWNVAIGDQILTRAELLELARLKSPLVKFRGRWVELSPEEIAAAVAFWKSKESLKISAREALHLALGARPAIEHLEFAGVDASGWLGDLIKRLQSAADFDLLPSPSGFIGILRPYQARGLSWLAFLRKWGLGACLADDMGLGKTIQTLALIQHEWETNPEARRPSLLVCPTSVVGNWKKEAARFTPDLPVLVHHGGDRTRGSRFRSHVLEHAIVITSYALLQRDQELFDRVAWGTVVLDEAQNIKNAETKQARAARLLKAEHRIALTGTPVENHVGDLWSIMEFLNPGWLGSAAEFRRKFLAPIQAGHDPAAANRLKALSGPFILRRLKTDQAIIADLPQKHEITVYCNLTREQGSLYTAVVEETLERIRNSEGMERKGLVLATLMRLKQVCNHPAHYLRDRQNSLARSGKLTRLREMLEEALSVGDRALIFTQFAEMGEILRDQLQVAFGREVLFLHGATTKTARDRMIERFQSSDRNAPALFVLSLKAGGVGLNLTAASHVFHFDRWWNPAVENQASDRAYRIGQTKRVQVNKFVCLGTLEEQIAELIEKKKAIAGMVVGSGDAWLTELSNAQLRDLLTLRTDAIVD